jgi:hypothetical protein
MLADLVVGVIVSVAAFLIASGGVLAAQSMISGRFTASNCFDPNHFCGLTRVIPWIR